jgi:hypothetical protein
MSTETNYKDLLDKPDWRPLALAQQVNGAGTCLSFDLRNDRCKDPFLWHWYATTLIDKYLKANDEWGYSANFAAVGGTIAAGARSIDVPSHGPFGTVGGTPTASSFTLSALPNGASVGINGFTDSGDKEGYKIRVIGNGPGGSGKTETRMIAANSAGATPVISLSEPLTFTPQVTDRYEMPTGRNYLLGSGTTAAGFFKAYDIATDTISGNLSVTNLATTIGTGTDFLSLDEQLVPHDREPGEGYLVDGSVTYDSGSWVKNCLRATATSGASITGMASTGDYAVLANEYRNFQIRIVEDTTTPTAVGQRRKITSHTAGPGAVYTVPTWTVTPSNNAKFVIENNNDLLCWTGANAVTYSYAAGGFAADAAWSTAAVVGGATQYANPPASLGNAGGMSVLCSSITPDVQKNARHSHVLVFRGASTNTLYQLDIAGGPNGVWTTPTYGNQNTSTVFTTGSCLAQAPATNEGQYAYINLNAGPRVYRFNIKSRALEPFCYLRYGQSTARDGQRMATGCFIDGNKKIGVLYLLRSSGSELFDCVVLR